MSQVDSNSLLRRCLSHGSLNSMNASVKINQGKGTSDDPCEMCVNYEHQLQAVQNEKLNTEKEIATHQSKIDGLKNELEREVQRRCKLEEQFTDVAKRSSDQIAELIEKSDRDDAKLNDLRHRFQAFCTNNTECLERYKTDRDSLIRRLEELRRENDHLLGRYIAKSSELQDDVIDLPQKIDELQFHCLELREKLIIATMEKERLEQIIATNPTPSNEFNGPAMGWQIQ